MLVRIKKCRLVKEMARCSTVVGGFSVAVKLAQYRRGRVRAGRV